MGTADGHRRRSDAESISQISVYRGLLRLYGSGGARKEKDNGKMHSNVLIEQPAQPAVAPLVSNLVFGLGPMWLATVAACL